MFNVACLSRDGHGAYVTHHAYQVSRIQVLYAYDTYGIVLFHAEYGVYPGLSVRGVSVLARDTRRRREYYSSSSSTACLGSCTDGCTAVQLV